MGQSICCWGIIKISWANAILKQRKTEDCCGAMPRWSSPPNRRWSSPGAGDGLSGHTATLPLSRVTVTSGSRAQFIRRVPATGHRSKSWPQFYLGDGWKPDETTQKNNSPLEYHAFRASVVAELFTPKAVTSHSEVPAASPRTWHPERQQKMAQGFGPLPPTGSLNGVPGLGGPVPTIGTTSRAKLWMEETLCVCTL